MRIIFFLVIPGAITLLLIGLVVYSKLHPVSLAEWAKDNDPLLAKLIALNPGMEFAITGTTDETKMPFYSVRNPATGRMVIFPTAEAENAKIRVSECDLSAIPVNRLYPHRTETACVEIENDKHHLHAVYFRTAWGDEGKVVDFYNLLIDPASRIRIAQRPGIFREEERREDGTRKLLYSYLLYKHVDVEAFVGYSEDPQPNHDAH